MTFQSAHVLFSNSDNLNYNITVLLKQKNETNNQRQKTAWTYAKRRELQNTKEKLPKVIKNYLKQIRFA